ncbi:MAG TPA: alpha/beta hydrolase [Planctomycetota bacterium]|nr:alpha/beta hydrolase [Planctomycetota bacterium]
MNTLTSQPTRHRAYGLLALFTALSLGWPVARAQDATPANASAASTAAATIHHRRAVVGDVDFFYREAGPGDAPVVLLLHGFPTSSHMFRNLIPELATTYRVIAPDLPGFGFTKAPERGTYAYSFDNLAASTGRFVDALGLQRYAIYVFDYGAPVGFRLALAHPERVTALISQNGNAYEEGLSKAWAPIQRYWREPTEANRNALRELFKLPATQFPYFHGVADPTLVAPESWALDQALLDRPGNVEIQLDLFGDYKANVALYPRFQAYFREHRPPTLAVWGKHDPFFLPPGAEAYKRDNPDAEVHFVDGGHFPLETHGREIAAILRDFLARTAGRMRRKA